MKPSELLATPEKWTKIVYARNENGLCVDDDSKEAVSFCLIGAIRKCYPNAPDRLDAVVKLKETLGQSIPEFNDAPETTHEMILEKLKEAGL